MKLATSGSGEALQETELLDACECFRASDRALDRLLELDGDPSDEQFMAFHALWFQMLQQVLVLPARNLEGALAKSAVMQNVMQVLEADVRAPVDM